LTTLVGADAAVYVTSYDFLPPADERGHAISASSHGVLEVN